MTMENDENDSKNIGWEKFVEHIEHKTLSNKHQAPLPDLPKHRSIHISHGIDSMEDLLERPVAQDLSDVRNELPFLTHGSVDNIDRQTATRFIRGKMPIEGTLDLHGYRQEEALNKLQIFIGHAYHKGYRNLLVITGKGSKSQIDASPTEGVLKERVPDWLNHTTLRAYILAFSYAQPQDGGTGALYVLMKRNRDR